MEAQKMRKKGYCISSRYKDKRESSKRSVMLFWYRDDIVENPDSSTDEAINYQWFQDIIPFSKFNFKDNDLTELNKAIDFIYQIYY